MELLLNRLIGEEKSSICGSVVSVSFLYVLELRLYVPEGSQFDLRDITNPAIQHHYKGLEALALGQKEPDVVVDITDLEQSYLEGPTNIAKNWLIK